VIRQESRFFTRSVSLDLVREPPVGSGTYARLVLRLKICLCELTGFNQR
jgi:hypothetical protein